MNMPDNMVDFAEQLCLGPKPADSEPKPFIVSAPPPSSYDYPATKCPRCGVADNKRVDYGQRRCWCGNTYFVKDAEKAE